MKNIGMSIFAIMVLVSCGKKEAEKTTEVNNTTTETKTVVVDTVAKPAAEPEPDGTSVKVGSDGVEIKSKDGEKNTSVEIKK